MKCITASCCRNARLRRVLGSSVRKLCGDQYCSFSPIPCKTLPYSLRNISKTIFRIITGPCHIRLESHFLEYEWSLNTLLCLVNPVEGGRQKNTNWGKSGLLVWPKQCCFVFFNDTKKHVFWSHQ